MANPAAVQSSLYATNWIGGKWVDSPTRADSFDPATGEKIGTYADADVADVRTAITAAREAFRFLSWRDDRYLRSRVMNELASAFEEKQGQSRSSIRSRHDSK